MGRSDLQTGKNTQNAPRAGPDGVAPGGRPAVAEVRAVGGAPGRKTRWEKYGGDRSWEVGDGSFILRYTRHVGSWNMGILGNEGN
jgi:hypothetical protein